MDSINWYLFLVVADVNINNDLTLSVNQQSISSDFSDSNNLPTLSVSRLAEYFQENIIGNLSITFNTSDDSLVTEVISSGMIKNNYGMFSVASSIFLENLALYYALNYDKSLLQYITEQDIKRVRSNIKILCNVLADYTSYQSMVFEFRDVDIALGYIQNQVELLYKDLNFRIY